MKITKIKAAKFLPDSDDWKLRVYYFFFYTSHCFISLLFLHYPLRLRVQTKALCEQHRHIYSLPEFLALHFGKTFLPSPLLNPSSFPPSLPSSTHPSLLSHGCFQTDPRPMCTRCPPWLHPIPQPVTAHSSVRYRQMELLSVLASLSLSLPLSPTLHAVYFVFLFLIPYQVKNK